jgi:putative acetyltransferase
LHRWSSSRRDAASSGWDWRRCPFVVVVGHPEYYPRFGFEPASAHGLVSQWEGIPDEAFMVPVLDPHAMAGISGVAMYRDEFNE